MNGTAPDDPAGLLHIRLAASPDGNGRCCQIRSSRPLRAARAFVGRAPEETARLLPRLFSVCALAQAAACAEALERAGGHAVAPGIAARRAALVASETLREHLWRILLDWPALAERAATDPPDPGGLEQARSVMAAVMARARAIQAALDPDGGLFRPGAVPDDRLAGRWPAAADDAWTGIAALVETWILGMPPARWLADIGDRAALAAWAARADTGAARLIRAVLAHGAAVGAVPVAPLPAVSDADLIVRLGGTAGDDFAARPDWDGRARETTPLTRHAGHPLLADPVAGAGTGLLGRLVAQLVEVAALADPASAALLPPAGPDTAMNASGANSGVGIGRAAAARGLLIHLARVADGRVTDYRILAPTEWNFHPAGVVARALEALPDGDADTLRWQATALITAIDPCVGFLLALGDK